MESVNAFSGNNAARKYCVRESGDDSILIAYKTAALWNAMADQIFEP